MKLNLLIIASVIIDTKTTLMSTSVAAFDTVMEVDIAIYELKKHNHVQDDQLGVIHYEWMKLFDESRIRY